jgi:hypothetical protein
MPPLARSLQRRASFLIDTLAGPDVQAATIEQIGARLAPLRDDVLTVDRASAG